MCLNPKLLIKDGKYKQQNYRGEKGEYYCIKTFTKCGVCEQCIADKSNNWVIRNYYEAKNWKNICFITLTYKENPYFLVKKDLQDFIKRLRQNLHRSGFDKKIRFFACGEYGSKKGRPHFHMIIYNWYDIKRYYTGINKKGNLLFESDIIKKSWGKGITSYQEFDSHEIPYISLYNTPSEQFSKNYKLKLSSARKLRENIRNIEKTGGTISNNQLKMLKREIEIMEKEKQEYRLIKEFNTWSIALGWEKFYDEYSKAPKYVFTEYIEDCEYPTPSPWVKKLANMGDVQAIEEMKRREEAIKNENTAIEEAIKNQIIIANRKKQQILDQKKKESLEEDF